MKRSQSPTPSCQSRNSADSMERPIDLSRESCTGEKRDEQRSQSPTPSCQSRNSADSMERPIDLSRESCTGEKREQNTIPALQRHTLVEVSGNLEQRLCQQHHRVLEVFCETDQTHICKVCAVEEHKGHSKHYREIPSVPDTKNVLLHTLRDMKTDQFKTFKIELGRNYPEFLGSPLKDSDVSGVVERMLECFGGEHALRIVLHFLDLASSRRRVSDTNKTNLTNRFQNIIEGISPQGKLSILSEIYTEIYITEAGSGEVNNEHEVRQIEMTSKRQTAEDTPIKFNDIFNALPGKSKQIRTVLTKGVAGIGKTVSVQKFILDWAEGKTNQDIMVIVPLPFRDLNLKKENYSLIQILHHFAPELQQIKDIEDPKLKLLIILDSLDEYRSSLDFQNNELCSDVTKSTSVDVLLTNLIRGHLLPSALLWITSRPAAANQIPPECVHRVTEIRGFDELQKEEYFRKRISDQSLASKMIRYIKSSRSLYIMCHIPVFCWLSATVLEYKMNDEDTGEMPKTLTEMYTHFLLFQVSLKNRKYYGNKVENPKKLSHPDKEMILRLGELAFQQLEKGNLVFYEEDLIKCGIDVSKASEYSSVCTEIFREELGLYREKVFCFVHLTIQEHLAAVYAHISCVNQKKDVFGSGELSGEDETFTLSKLHQTAVDKALQSENGHLDLFLRLLLGLSQGSNHILLQDLMTESSSEMRETIITETIKYIKSKISEELSPERIINLFHCLDELNDSSLVEEIQTAFKSGTLSAQKLEPHQCSALAYMFLISEEVLDEFDLKMYKTSAAGQQRLLPVLRTCKRARLDHCNISSESCKTIASALKTVNSPLEELDLSYNNLTDLGMKHLSAGVMSSNCKLQKLRLRECSLTDVCCKDLAALLGSHHSNLTELEMRDNDLKDSGVNLLSTGLENSNCKLHKLGLSGCQITEEGCASLASALRTNPSHLRVLDLSYNHTGDRGAKLFSSLRDNPQCKLEKLKLDFGGECRMKPGLRKYVCQLTLDENTAHRNLSLSEGNRKVRGMLEEQPYPDHPERFTVYYQVLCTEPLTERCYWEVEWSGLRALIGVTHKSIDRHKTLMGTDGKSFSMICLDSLPGFWVCHNEEVCLVRAPPMSSPRIGLYLDWSAGTLSFYNVSKDTMTLLHTFKTTFTEPLYAGFEIGAESSVTLCQLE